MTFSERLARLNSLQQGLWFKLVATGVVVALAVAALVTYSVRSAALQRAEADTLITIPTAEPKAPGTAEDDRTKAPTAEAQATEEIRRMAEANARVIRNIQMTRYSVGSIAVGLGLGVLVCLAVVWIGSGLTYLAVAAAALVTAAPLVVFGNESWRGLGLFLSFSLTLASVFSGLMQALRVALSASNPVTAIARNVVSEAVRMRITVVFMVVLIVALAALPGTLDANTPLRYRVQAFLQYGAGGAFWLVSLLTVFLAAGSVAFEQRDKIIWQTMTKPVKAWQYVLGKWLGVAGVSAVLLLASAAGIFLFTEYLRNGKAPDERAPFVPADETLAVTEDRLVLESQILVARETVRPTIPPADAAAINAEVKRRFDLAMQEFNNDLTQVTPRPDEQRIMMDVARDRLTEFLSIPPNLDRPHLYEFDGLKAAKDLGRPLTFRYRFNAGSNLPTDLYRVTFLVPGWNPQIVSAPLGQTLSMTLSASAITEKQVQNNDGSTSTDWVLPVYIFNGDLSRQTVNRETIVFPPDGLELSYPVSDWRWNFVRAAVVLWLKTTFLAMVAIAASTFLSFPVACLTAFGVLWMAEGATFLANALDNYGTIQGSEREFLWWRVPIIAIATPISTIFRFYSDLSPVANVVEGRLLSWNLLVQSTIILGSLNAALFAIGSFIFRRRELATYSGQ